MLGPAEILAESFRIIDGEVGPHPFDPAEWSVVRRMIHASGDLDLVHDVAFTPGAVLAGVKALREGSLLVTDVRMVAAGIQQPLLAALGVGLHCFIDDQGVRQTAESRGMTRSWCAMERAVTAVGDAVYVVGNAPTALLALCAAVQNGSVCPLLVIAMPVGFVAVAESKEEALALGIPVLAVRGRKGGSAVAAAAVNALLLLAGGGATMSGHPIVVVGIGHDGPGGLSAEALGHIAAARVLAGGRRHLAFFPDWAGVKIAIDADLGAFVSRLRECRAGEKTVVLASGDPLFYGIGAVLLQSFPKESLVFLPQVSAVQLAFARVKESWHDARVVSLHGRPLDALRPCVEERADKIAALTDGTNHPAAIAAFLRRLGAAEDYTLWVCENLGGPDERVSRRSPEHMADETFSPLNVVVLTREGRGALGHTGTDSAVPLLGIPEGELLHRTGQRGLITRREVRVMALCYLELRADNVLWDIGAGSGSVSIEAARLSPGLRALAVERDAVAFAQLETNASRLGCGRVQTVRGEAPEALEALPEPDAVFVGGSGGRLRDILTMAVRRLKPGGRVVLNCITLETLSGGWECLRSLGLEPEVTSVQLAHSRPLGRLHSLEPDNLIFILRARKP